jgi:hypothetical protein
VQDILAAFEVGRDKVGSGGICFIKKIRLGSIKIISTLRIAMINLFNTGSNRGLDGYHLQQPLF